MYETHKNRASNTKRTPDDYLREFEALAEQGLPSPSEIPTSPWQRFFLPPGPWCDYDEETGEPYETWVDAPNAVVAAALADIMYGSLFKSAGFARIEWKDADGEHHTFFQPGPEGVTPEWIELTLTQALGAHENEQSNGEERS